MKRNAIATALCALGCAVVLAGCGNLTKSPADGLSFKAPDGFTSEMSALGMLQVWTKNSGGDTQALMLFRSPIAGGHMNVDEAMKNAKVDNSDVSVQKKITLCGNQDALLIHAKGTVGNAFDKSGKTVQKDNLEMVILQASAPIMAMYSYPIGATPDPMAEAAIKELCSAPAATST